MDPTEKPLLLTLRHLADLKNIGFTLCGLSLDGTATGGLLESISEATDQLQRWILGFDRKQTKSCERCLALLTPVVGEDGRVKP